MSSVRTRLLSSLLGAFFLIWVLLLISASWTSLRFLTQDLEAKLKNDANTILVMSKEFIDILPHTRFSGPDNLVHEIEFHTSLQIYRGETLVVTSPDKPDFPTPTELSNKAGFTTVIIDEIEWRLFYSFDTQYGLWTILGEPTEALYEPLYDFLLTLIWPIFFALPLAALAILLAVRSSFHPLEDIVEQISSRRADESDAISIESVPVEIKPLIVALNNLLERLNAALMGEKNFTDNAAHELRTPLAAIKTEVQVAQRNATQVETKSVLNRLLPRVNKAAHLIDQLLDLARIQASETAAKFELFSLTAVALDVLTNAANTALDKEIEFLFDEAAEHSLLGNRDLIQILLRNLIENAIKYTPANGKISLWVEPADNSLTLIIADTGPGISDEIRVRIFDCYYRGPAVTQGISSGLGMAIVHRIAGLHDASINLTTPRKNSGLQVEVCFKLASRYPVDF